MKFSLFAHTPDHTHQIGTHLGRAIKLHTPEQVVLAINGDLGAGKTMFVQGLAYGLEIAEVPTSPTFAIMEEYPPLLHIDLYRLEEHELEPLGIEEHIELWRGVIAIEWAEKFLHILPAEMVTIQISIEDTTRRFDISSAHSLAWLSQWNSNTKSFSSCPQ